MRDEASNPTSHLQPEAGGVAADRRRELPLHFLGFLGFGLRV